MNQGMPQQMPQQVMGKGQQFAGIGALGRPASMPKGRPPETMNQIMSLARKMSDAQLADVLAGRSLDVPQFAAMTEAMGRKKLRMAMQGAEAMTQANQPTIKDKLVASNLVAGIDQLPAANMDTVDMASGGIVAFEDGGDVIDPYGGMDDDALAADQARVESILGRRKQEEENKRLQEEREKYQFLKQSAPDVAAKMLQSNPALEPTKEEPTRTVAAAPAPTTTRGQAPAAKAQPEVAAGRSFMPGASGVPSYEDLLKRRTTDYLSGLEGLSKKQRESLAEIKKQGMGEGLMQLAAGILSAPNLSRGLAKGLPLFAASSAATRKEARAVENLANEYDFNIAKAREAAERGDMGLALQYEQIANQNKYQAGMLDVYKQRNAIMGEGSMLPKVQLGLKNADAQALAEAKQKFPILTKANQAAFDAFIKKRSYELKMENPLTKPYASLGSGDIGGGAGYNVVQSLPKGASVIDLE